MDFRFMALSLRGSEATEAKQGEAEASLVIHKKADSSMDCHALQSKARDDGKTSNATNPKHITQVFKTTRRILGFLMDFARCVVASKEIRLCAYRRELDTNSRKRRKKTESKTKGGKL